MVRLHPTTVANGLQGKAVCMARGPDATGLCRRAQLPIEFFQPLRRADIDPCSAMMFAADFPQRDLFAQQGGERCLAAAREVGEQRRTIQADAAECPVGSVIRYA